jgi:hypothetical protein
VTQRLGAAGAGRCIDVDEAKGPASLRGSPPHPHQLIQEAIATAGEDLVDGSTSAVSVKKRQDRTGSSG